METLHLLKFRLASASCFHPGQLAPWEKHVCLYRGGGKWCTEETSTLDFRFLGCTMTGNTPGRLQ